MEALLVRLAAVRCSGLDAKCEAVVRLRAGATAVLALSLGSLVRMKPWVPVEQNFMFGSHVSPVLPCFTQQYLLFQLLKLNLSLSFHLFNYFL